MHAWRLATAVSPPATVRGGRIGSEPPLTPPPGEVDVGLGLLVARTTGPLATDARAALLTYFTTTDSTPIRAAAIASRLTKSEVRTWVGQISRLATQVGPPPSLLEAVAELRKGARPSDDAAVVLADLGLVRDELDPVAVLRLAGLFRVPDVPILIRAGGHRWVIPAADVSQMRTWRRRAAARLTVIGLAPTDSLPPLPHGLPVELVEGSLGGPEGVRFHSGWMWRIDSRGRIPRLTRTLLLIGPQTPNTIAAGLGDQRMTVPPTTVLAAWLESVPWARPTSAGRYTARRRDESVLGKWDRVILDHVRAGKPLTTAALGATLQLDRNHLGATLRRSVLLEHSTYGRWNLRRALPVPRSVVGRS